MAGVYGPPGFMTIGEGGIAQATALRVEQATIPAIHVTRIPERLGGILPPHDRRMSTLRAASPARGPM